jgi:hypothetical protein
MDTLPAKAGGSICSSSSDLLFDDVVISSDFVTIGRKEHRQYERQYLSEEVAEVIRVRHAEQAAYKQPQHCQLCYYEQRHSPIVFMDVHKLGIVTAIKPTFVRTTATIIPDLGKQYCNSGS